MEITVREFRSEDTKDAIAIWNEVVDQGKAFPQLEDLGVEDGEAFFKEQSYTGIAVNENDEIVGLYILHPNNIGRCGHICNAGIWGDFQIQCRLRQCSVVWTGRS